MTTTTTNTAAALLEQWHLLLSGLLNLLTLAPVAP